MTETNIYQKIFFTGILMTALLAIYSLATLDLTKFWVIPLALCFLILLFLIGIYKIQALLALILLLAPVLYKFNYLKINITDLLPLDPSINFSLNIITLIYIIIIFIGLATFLENYKKIKNIPLFYIIISFLFYVILSIFWSDQKGTSLIYAVYTLIPFLMYFYSYIHFSGKKNLLKLLIISIVSIIPGIAIAVWQITTNNYFYDIDSSLRRLSGNFAHPNSFGLLIFLAIAILTIIYFSNKSIKKNQNIFLISLAVLIIFLVLTYSRVSWLCLILFFIIFAFIKKRLFLYMAFLAPFAIILSLSINTVKKRLIEFVNFSVFSSWTARLNIWKIAWINAIKKPILGYGIGTSEKLIEDTKTWEGGSSLPHNDILLHIIELGSIGLILFLVYTFGAIYKVSKLFKELPDKYDEIKIFEKKYQINFKIICFGILSILISILIANIFESASQKIIIQMMIWSILGSLFSLSNKYETK